MIETLPEFNKVKHGISCNNNNKTPQTTTAPMIITMQLYAFYWEFCPLGKI